MGINFRESKTKDNLMRAFAGESQARNRYTFAADIARKAKLPVLERIFLYTANQEKEHAEIFYHYLRGLNGQTITVDGGYPVDLQEDVEGQLRAAMHNEYEEAEDVYRRFMKTAKEEGFHEVAASFQMIAEIEKTHGDRFKKYAGLLERGTLFKEDTEETWICLNCGYIFMGKEVPAVCPSCREEQGYFVRAKESIAPFLS